MRGYGDTEIALNSVERVSEYLKIEQEAASIIDDHRPNPEVLLLIIYFSGLNPGKSMWRIWVSNML